MAIDSASKRNSVVGIPGLPISISIDGSFDQGDRQTIGWSYRGILAPVPVGTGVDTPRDRRSVAGIPILPYSVLPDGSLNEIDRATIGWSYAGISIAGPVIVLPFKYIKKRGLLSSYDVLKFKNDSDTLNSDEFLSHVDVLDMKHDTDILDSEEMLADDFLDFKIDTERMDHDG